MICWVIAQVVVGLWVAHRRQHLLLLLLEGVGDVFDEDQSKDQMLVFSGIIWARSLSADAQSTALKSLWVPLSSFVLASWVARLRLSGQMPAIHPDSRCVLLLGKRVIRRVRHGGLLPDLILDPSGRVRPFERDKNRPLWRREKAIYDFSTEK